MGRQHRRLLSGTVCGVALGSPGVLSFVPPTTTTHQQTTTSRSWVPSSAFTSPLGFGTHSQSISGCTITRGPTSTRLYMTGADGQKTVVVIGNGMVGHKFCEKLTELDNDNKFKIVTFCEEKRSAYNRMRLTEFFAKRDVNDLSMAGLYNDKGTTSWYEENDVEVFVGDKATLIDKEQKLVKSEQGREIAYDYAVLATGSYPFVPPTPGVDKKGVFVYRTIDDLEAMIAYQKEHGVKAAAVIGGGLLGLEAAKAMYDLGMETHIIEYAPILMCRQIDQDGHNTLAGMIEDLGLKIHCNARVSEFVGEEAVAGLAFSNEGWDTLDVGMVVVSAGIRPRDEIARSSGIKVHERGGVMVDDAMRTDDPNIFAIGEVALHGGMIYGLVAPGYQMADAVAHNLARPEADPLTFTGADMSTKLKLMGVDVASFGKYSFPPGTPDVQPLVWNDPFKRTYKKLVFNKAGTRLLGGILVGDASDYTNLLGLSKADKDLPMSPRDLLVGATAEGGAGAMTIDDMPDEMQVCSCNNVDKGAITKVIMDGSCTTVGAVKSCTKAGTGCGGCEPLVKDIFKATMAKMGTEVKNHLCEHFAYSRAELYDITKVMGYKTFDEMLKGHGTGCGGCEICKPTAGSILATLHNELILEPQHETLQDTNDRALANMQRGGSYSVVPRVPGGEITPLQLITMGKVAEEYGLYTKITGGQRVDLFGAEKHQLPEIWEKLGKAGLESGHAYGKALRTVKSCVGKDWCRYGVGDSTAFAIRVENRYKGLRSPHKLKGGVSGCIRECAEAQGKDFGMIATENGYNLYVCGNGGSQPRHADLLAADIDEDTCVKYVDRFLMYYCATADRLERTSKWMDRLEGGIEFLKDVVINDRLGLNAEFDARMQHVVDTYQDEWATVYNDPERRKKFAQFVNTEETERGIKFVESRGQQRPVYWPKDGEIPVDLVPPKQEVLAGFSGIKKWVKMGEVSDFPKDGGAAVKYGKSQLAIFYMENRNGPEWYATQNMCPHKRAMVLSQGIVGDKGGAPKVACPLHKKNFDLSSGQCSDNEEMSLLTFPVKVENNNVFVELPPAYELDRVLATEKVMIGGEDCMNTEPQNAFIPFDSMAASLSGGRNATISAR